MDADAGEPRAAEAALRESEKRFRLAFDNRARASPKRNPPPGEHDQQGTVADSRGRGPGIPLRCWWL